MTCRFCRPELKDKQRVVLENELCLFLQEPQDVLVGSGIIVPRSHRETVFDMTEEEWTATFDLLQRAKAMLDAEFGPDGYNVGWNNGAVAGQEVFHVHLHVIPRHEDEPLAGKGIRHWIKQPMNKRGEGGMKGRRNLPLLIDGLINLLLGILLLSFPAVLVDVLGLPPFQGTFYPTLLGAVLLGIGIALFIQRHGKREGMTGLGIAGAIAINVCGVGVLLFWLVVGDLRIPVRGRVILWAVAIVVLLIAVVEAASGAWRQRGDAA